MQTETLKIQNEVSKIKIFLDQVEEYKQKGRQYVTTQWLSKRNGGYYVKQNRVKIETMTEDRIRNSYDLDDWHIL